MQVKMGRYRDVVLLGLFAAIIFLLTLTPIGFINLVFIKATIIHVPVIIGSLVLGPKKGAVLGGCFGLASLISNTTAPSVLSFAFSPMIPVPGLERGSPLALIICFVPRILVGVVPGLLYRSLTRVKGLRSDGAKKNILTISGACGSLLNTILVMGMIAIFFKDAYASIKGIAVDALLGAIVASVGLQSVLEAVIAAVLAAIICPVLFRFRPDPYSTIAKGALKPEQSNMDEPTPNVMTLPKRAESAPTAEQTEVTPSGVRPMPSLNLTKNDKNDGERG